ncbi:MAG: radical SAM protein [Defluviitaleaceae bacterium]|nr:radical SAM protein [Defluviitaleaceae bacterium]
MKKSYNKITIYENSIKNKILRNVTIELLTKCNWRCKHCYIDSHTVSGLPKEKIFEILKELRKSYTFDITFTGGEIFFRQDTMEIIEYARNLGFNVSLLSNVSLLDEDKIKKLKKLNIFKMYCTIFSMNCDIHDNITTIKGSLEKSIENIKLIKKYGIDLEIRTILMKENQNEYKNIYNFCIENDIEYTATTSVFPSIDGCKRPTDLRIDDKQKLKEIIKDIDYIRKFDKKRDDIIQDSICCNILFNSLYIDSNGDIYPCNLLYIKLGDIYINNILDIWKNSPVLNELQNYKSSDLNSCNKCEAKDFCYRCTGIVKLEGKSIFEKDSKECELAFIRKSLFDD